LADDLLSTLLLSFDGPTVMAPAMNCVMWQKPSVQRNVAQLRADGLTFIDPEDGYLSCGMRGPGRMANRKRSFASLPERLEAGAEERGEGRGLVKQTQAVFKSLIPNF